MEILIFLGVVVGALWLLGYMVGDANKREALRVYYKAKAKAKQVPIPYEVYTDSKIALSFLNILKEKGFKDGIAYRFEIMNDAICRFTLTAVP